jgi:hypothetical protein
MPNYFHLVAEIREEEKYFDISLNEIERQLRHSNKFKFEGELILTDDGEEVTIPVSLHIGSTDGCTAWTVAITLHNERVDCIDYEKYYSGASGAKESGWHRHEWDAASQNCEILKVPSADLAEEMELRDFLVRSFQLMRILLNAEDHGNYELQFNQNIPD